MERGRVGSLPVEDRGHGEVRPYAIRRCVVALLPWVNPGDELPDLEGVAEKLYPPTSPCQAATSPRDPGRSMGRNPPSTRLGIG